MYSFSRVAVTKYHELSGLKQEKVIVAQFWRLEAWSLCVRRAVVPVKLTGEFLLASPWPLVAS